MHNATNLAAKWYLDLVDAFGCINCHVGNCLRGLELIRFSRLILVRLMRYISVRHVNDVIAGSLLYITALENRERRGYSSCW
jgi:hypothetical protein